MTTRIAYYYHPECGPCVKFSEFLEELPYDVYRLIDFRSVEEEKNRLFIISAEVAQYPSVFVDGKQYTSSAVYDVVNKIKDEIVQKRKSRAVSKLKKKI